MKRKIALPFLTLAFASILFSACQNKDKKAYQDEIIGIEKAYEEDNTLAAELTQKMEAYIKAFPDEKDQAAHFTYRIGELYFEKKDIDNAILNLQKGIDTYQQEDATPKSLRLLGDIYKMKGDLTKAVQNYAKLVQTYPTHEAAQGVKNTLTELDVVKQQIANLEQMAEDTSMISLRASVFSQLARAYKQYAALAPDSTDVDDKLFKAAQNHASVGDFPSAVEIWKDLVTDKPETKLAKDAMFQMAYIYEQMSVQLPEGDSKKKEYLAAAEKYYKLFIQKYPKDEMAESAKVSLQFLGKSADEMLKGIQQKQK